jgi:hypothetical protein
LSQVLQNWTPSSDELNQQDNERNYQQEMNVSTDRVAAHNSNHPADEQNYEYYPKHGSSPRH